MRRQWREMPLPIAFGLALLLHGGVALLLAPGFDRDAVGSPAPRAALSPDALHPPDDEPPEFQLGIDAPTPSSMTWIGYDTYLEHIARLSEVEQAEFDDDEGLMSGSDAPASDGTPGPPLTDVATDSMVAEMEATESPMEPVAASAIDQVVDSTSPPEAVSVADDAGQGAIIAVDEPIDLPLPPVDELHQDTRPGLVDEADAPPSVTGPTAPPADATEGTPVPPLTAEQIESIAAALMPGLTEIRPRPRSASESEPALSEESAETVTPAPDEVATAEPTPPTQPAQPTPAQEAAEPSQPASGTPASSPAPNRRDETGAARSGEGRESDRESVATSIIDVPLAHLRSGRPLAAHGLELLTRNPVFPILTSVTAAPRNPLVEIHFGHDGRPRHAGLLESSGDSRIDGPVVDSLFRWRARGAALDDLDPEDRRSVIVIRMRILLRSR